MSSDASRSAPAPLTDTVPPDSRRRLRDRIEPWWVLAVIAVAVAFIGTILGPAAIFGPGLAATSDLGAQWVAPWVFGHVLLGRLQPTGWSSSMLGGWPVGVFYFPVPLWSAALLGRVVPFAVAFKLVVAGGILAVPPALGWLCWTGGAGRVGAVAGTGAGVAFVLQDSYSIWGGNLLSALGGEYASTWSLAFALVAAGALIKVAQGAGRRWSVVAVVACGGAVGSHIIGAVAAGVACAIVMRWALGRYGARRAAGVGGLGLLGVSLLGWWWLPLLTWHSWMTGIGFGRDTALNSLWPVTIEWALAFSLIGAVVGVRRGWVGAWVGLGWAVVGAWAFLLLPGGLVINGRALPVYYLGMLVLAAFGVVVVGGWLRAPRTTATLGVIAVIAAQGLRFGMLAPPPSPTALQHQSLTARYINPVNLSTQALGGYQSLPAWPRFHRLMQGFSTLGKTTGCGEFVYETTPIISNQYGSPFALDTAGYWTNGCLRSAYGLWQESAPWFRLAALAQKRMSFDGGHHPSGIPQQPFAVCSGAQILSQLGVKYFASYYLETRAAAQACPLLHMVGGAGHWRFFTVAGARTVATISRARTSAPLGPKAAATKSIAMLLGVPTKAGTRYTPPPPVLLGAVRPAVGQAGVSAVHVGSESVSFTVARTGVPVLVKVPYFPAWQLVGGGVITQSLPLGMVVVPRHHHVVLSYQTWGTAEIAGTVITVLGLLVTLLLGWRGWSWLREDYRAGRQALE